MRYLLFLLLGLRVSAQLVFNGPLVNCAPTISGQPASITRLTNTSAPFGVTAAGPYLFYQWRTNGVNAANGIDASGATTSSFTLSNTPIGMSNASVTCVVSNVCGSITSSVAMLTITNGTGGGTFDLLIENFEGSNNGFDLAGWDVSNIGAANQNYTTSPMQGAEGFRIAGDSEYIFHTFTGQNEVDGSFDLRIDALPASGITSVVRLYTSGLSTRVVTVGVDSTGAFTVRQGSVDFGTTSATAPTGTKLWVWYHYKNDGSASVGWSTDGTRPTSGTHFLSDVAGDATGTAAVILPGKFGTGTFVYDRIGLSTGTIGDNP